MQNNPINIQGPVGNIEAILELPKNLSIRIDMDSAITADSVAIICHPHPQFEGTMHNKVVTTVAKTFVNANIPAIRFNYRGVGKSEGSYDNAVGEIKDCLAVVKYINAKFNNPKIWLAGFSFGAYIALQTAVKINAHKLIMIAPAVHHHPEYSNTLPCSPTLVIQGEEDEIVPPGNVYEWFYSTKAKLDIGSDFDLIRIKAASHFFHGKLIELRNEIATHFGF